MIKKVLLLFISILLVKAAFPQTAGTSEQQQNWVDSVYKALNKNERLAQLFIITLNEENSHRLIEKVVKEDARENRLGGLFFEHVPIKQQVELINDCRKASKTPLIVGMDVAAGLYPSVKEALPYPNAITLNQVTDQFLLAKKEQHTFEQMNILGANSVLSPKSGDMLDYLNEEVLYQLGINRIYTNPKNTYYMLGATNIALSVKALKKAIRKGQIDKGKIEQNIRSILMAKYPIRMQPKFTSPDNLERKLNNPKFNIIIEELYKSAISVRSNNLIPVQVIDTTTFSSLTFGSNPTTCNDYLNRYAMFSNFSFSKQSDSILLTKLSSFEVVVVNVLEKLKPEQLDWLNQLQQKSKIIICNYEGNSDTFEEFDHVITAHENNDITQRLVPQFIFGAVSNSGQAINRLAYSIPEAVGIDSDVLRKIDEIAYETVAKKSSPGCQILIAKDGKVIYDKSFGYYTYDSLKPVTYQTIYDLASITKVAATLQAVIFMLDNGLIDLDHKISYYLPELKGTNKENMIIRDILSHQAGLWPWIPFWKETMDNTMHLPGFYSYHPQEEYPFYVARGLYSHAEMEERVWQWVIESDLREKQDKTPYDYKYSDMGYYMLYRLAEKLLNQPIEDFLAQNIYEPLGANTLNYLPLCKFPEDVIAPTENDTAFRQSQLLGTVHDQGAAMIGGVAGHAGLFSNANDLAKLMQMHLQNGSYGGHQYFRKETLDELIKPQYESNRRGVGWDKPIPGTWYGPTGELASAKTYGHTGFTGTAAWVDPEFNLVYIFLSNRVYPDAANPKLYQTNIRTRIQDLIYKAIWSYCDKKE